MAIVKVEVELAKEVDDVGLFLAELVRDIRAKKPATAIMAENIVNLTNAIAGVDQVDDEFALNRKVALETIGRQTGNLTDAIIGVKAST